MQPISAMVCSFGDSDLGVETMLAALRATGTVTLTALSVGQALAAADAASDVALLQVAPAALEVACDALGALREAQPMLPSLVIGPALSRPGVERLIARGAFDFVGNPLSEDELLIRIRRMLGVITPAQSHADANACSTPIARVLAARSSAHALIGHSPTFSQQLRKLPRIAGCDAGVLILGETGSGKEVCAQAIHYASSRAAGPWVAINCAAIPSELVEDELFGHVRGAYTHAHATRQGLVAEAEGGTLFLDEIDSLPLSAQAKLLRFLQDKQYRPVGSNALRQAHVRLIAATNHRLDEAVAQGRFRQDLYFRLNVLTLTLPPLRERRDDIPALAQHFFAQAQREAGRRLSGGIAPSALRRLLEHGWPGNVRELKHTIERAVLLCEGTALRAGDIAFDGIDDAPLSGLVAADDSFRAAKARAVEAFERDYLQRTLAACGGNIAKASRLAGKNRRAYFELLRKHGIDAGRWRGEITA